MVSPTVGYLAYPLPSRSDMLQCRFPQQVTMARSISGGELGDTISRAIGTDRSVIPVVVAKCGLYLKEHATEVEGTFRISGSAKRMRDLQAVFDTGPKVQVPVFVLKLTVLVRKEHRLGVAPIHPA